MIEQQNIIINNLQFSIQSYQNIINQKEQELNNLKKQLGNINYQNKGNYVDMNKLMSVNFISVDQKIHFSVPCIDSDTFAEVEEKLYKKYNNFRDTNNTPICSGKPILRFKILYENKIKDEDVVQIIKLE